MPKLTPDQIDARLAELPQWSHNADSLQRTFRFDDFVGAMAFANRIGNLAEDMQHHPDIMIRYNKVTLSLTTHDAGGLTERDFSFARAADGYIQTDLMVRTADPTTPAPPAPASPELRAAAPGSGLRRRGAGGARSGSGAAGG